MVKVRKPRYPVGDYGHKRWPRPLVLQVAVAIVPRSEPSGSEQQEPLTFAFHGAKKLMLTHVFTRLRGTLFANYAVTEHIDNQMLNGRSYLTLLVSVNEPNVNGLSPEEWPCLIAYLMERTFRCKVTYFAKYEKFLNT